MRKALANHKDAALGVTFSNSDRKKSVCPMPMKSACTRSVLVVSPEPFYEDRGTPIAVRQLVLALIQLGYKVSLLSYPLGRTIELSKGISHFRSSNPLGFRSVPVGPSLRKILLDCTLVYAFLRQLRRNDYYCVHAVEEAAFPAIVFRRFYQTPVIYDMQSSMADELAMLPGLRNPVARAILSRCERWLLKNADVVIASVGLGERVQSSIPSVRINEWHYGAIPAGSNHEDPEALRRTLGIGPGRRVVLYCGTFEPYQGLDNLILALPLVKARVPDCLFLLVGATAPYLERMKKRHRDLIDPGDLKIVERQPRAKVADFLALAELVISPRAYGANLPLKIFEYLAAGKPIIATDIQAHRSILNVTCARLTSVSHDSLAEAIIELLKHPDLATALGEAGRAYAESRFSWPKFVESVDQLYRSLE